MQQYLIKEGCFETWLVKSVDNKTEVKEISEFNLYGHYVGFICEPKNIKKFFKAFKENQIAEKTLELIKISEELKNLICLDSPSDIDLSVLKKEVK